MIRKDGPIVHLEEACGVEEAEVLLEALQTGEVTGLDLGRCRRLHTALIQLLILAKTPIFAFPEDPTLKALLSEVGSPG